jgi:hypothetical protein
VQSYRNPEVKHEIYEGGGIHPFWWQGGGRLQLFYRLPTKIERVQISTSPTFVYSKPTELLWSPMLVDGPDNPRKMDITGDGEHFIGIDQMVPTENDSSSGESIRVVLNWVAELTRRAATR